MSDEVRLRLPKLYPKQREAIFAPARIAVIEASTKSGKTVGCISWLLSQAWAGGRPGREYWWGAPVYPQTRIAYRRTKRMLQRAIPSKAEWLANETEATITLGNGAIIRFKSGERPDNLYGEDVYAAVVDEASRFREESWHALRSTLTKTRGPVRIIGNVKGRRNWAYKLGLRARSGEPDMHYARITAHDAVEAGVLEADEIVGAERHLPRAVFRELYLAEPSDDTGNPFGGPDIIRACVGPMSRAEPVCWGVDLAKSVDWTVAIALDLAGVVCGYQRWQGDWRNTMARLAAMIVRTPALVDATGVGDPIVEQLQARCPYVEGYSFSSRSKQQLMEGLAVAIQQKRVVYPDVPPVLDELEAFEYEYKRDGVRYSAPEGVHDDTVCALALAVMCHRRRPAPAGFDGGIVMDEADWTKAVDPWVARMNDERIWTHG